MKSYQVTTVFWSLYFLDVGSSQEGVVMLNFIFLISFVCFTGGATEFFSMRFSQLVCFSGYSGVFAFGHLFHNYQVCSDCHSRWTWPKELLNNNIKMNCCVKIFVHI